MKKLVKFSFNLYHLLFPNYVATCRFSPTCSQYALEAIAKYGFFLGAVKTAQRILSCHPFTKRPLYDPA